MSCISHSPHSSPSRRNRRGTSCLHALGLLMLGTFASGGGVGAQPQPLPGRVIDVRAGEFFLQAPDTIPAGVTTFRLTQVGMLATPLSAGLHGRALVADSGDDTRGAHMLWVVRLEDGKSAADVYRAARDGDRAPAWATQPGGPSGAHPPRSSNATLELAPGTYALVCYTGSARADRSRARFLRGMFRGPTVVPDASPAARAMSEARLPTPDARARITGEGRVTFSAPLTRGRQVIQVVNETGRTAEFKFQLMPAGLSGRDFLAQPEAAAPAEPWGGLVSVPPRKVGDHDERVRPCRRSARLSRCSAPGDTTRPGAGTSPLGAVYGKEALPASTSSS